MALAFWQFLRDNEPAEAMDVLATYLEEVNKLKLSKEKSISRSTIYRALRGKNVTIKTIAKVLHSLI
jgi:DNA-binding phage protein